MTRWNTSVVVILRAGTGSGKEVPLLEPPYPTHVHIINVESMSKKTIGVNAAIFNAHEQILLVKHTYGRKGWHLPGGGIEPNESIQDTAVRETYEETGLQVVAMSLSGIYYDPGQDCVVFVVVCRPQDGRGDRLCPDREEVSDCEFWSIDDLPTPISDFTINRIQDAVSGKTYPLPAVITPRQWVE